MRPQPRSVQQGDLPKLQTGDGERRKRHLYVAIDRRSRSVHLAVKDDETERSAIAFLREAAAAFPFRLTHVLTDNGSCFTAAFARACAELGAEHRHTKPRSPRTTDEVEQSLWREPVLSSSCPRVTARQRAGHEVRARPRSLQGRSSLAAPVGAFGPRRVQPSVWRR
jgi:transposase InsO family protein